MVDLRLQIAVMASSEDVFHSITDDLVCWWKSLDDYYKADYLDTIEELEIHDYIELDGYILEFIGTNDSGIPVFREET